MTVTAVSRIWGHVLLLQDRKAVQDVCEAVARRAARLCAVGIAGCVVKMGADATECVAGIDGSVFNLYPNFPQVRSSHAVAID